MLVQHIRDLPGAHTSRVQLVSIEGALYVLKTANLEEVANERLFQQYLGTHHKKSLLVDIPGLVLEPNQLLLRYIPDSPTLGEHLSPALVLLFGRELARLHDITFDTPKKVQESGEMISYKWVDYVRETLAYGKVRRVEKNSDLPVAMIPKIEKIVTERLLLEPVQSSLLHADVHANNVLLDGDEMILFDKRSDIFAGDWLYDVALVAIAFSNGLYRQTNDPAFAEDEKYWDAFLEGYGKEKVLSRQEELDAYVLLRVFEKYPNPFMGWLLTVAEGILKRN